MNQVECGTGWARQVYIFDQAALVLSPTAFRKAFSGDQSGKPKLTIPDYAIIVRAQVENAAFFHFQDCLAG